MLLLKTAQQQGQLGPAVSTCKLKREDKGRAAAAFTGSSWVHPERAKRGSTGSATTRLAQLICHTRPQGPTSQPLKSLTKSLGSLKSLTLKVKGSLVLYTGVAFPEMPMTAVALKLAARGSRRGS